MANTKKIVAFGLGVVVVGGLAWYLMTRRKEQRMTPMMTNLPPLVNTPTTTTASPVDVDFDTEIGIRNAGGLKVNINGTVLNLIVKLKQMLVYR